jgi:hypothetical protein
MDSSSFLRTPVYIQDISEKSWLLKLKCPAFFENVLWVEFIIPSGSLLLVKYSV